MVIENSSGDREIVAFLWERMLVLSANTFSDGLPMLTRLIRLQKLGSLALQGPMVRWTRMSANSGESPVACLSIQWTRLTAYSGDSNLWRVFGSGELLVQTLSRSLCQDSDRYVDVTKSLALSNFGPVVRKK